MLFPTRTGLSLRRRTIQNALTFTWNRVRIRTVLIIMVTIIITMKVARMTLSKRSMINWMINCLLTMILTQSTWVLGTHFCQRP
jgi:hypothetical protein